MSVSAVRPAAEAADIDRLKWVVVVDEGLPAGLAANAAACVAATVGRAMPGLLGPAGPDAAGALHHGLPQKGCAILAAPAERLTDLRAAAARYDDVFVADMPSHAQQTLSYDEYLDRLGRLAHPEISYCAVSLVGPRNRVSKLVNRLPLR